jgi:hypothetical protein
VGARQQKPARRVGTDPIDQLVVTYSPSRLDIATRAPAPIRWTN